MESDISGSSNHSGEANPSVKSPEIYRRRHGTWVWRQKAKHASTLDTFPFLRRPPYPCVILALSEVTTCSGSPVSISGESAELISMTRTLSFPCLTKLNWRATEHIYTYMSHVCNMHVSEFWRWQWRPVPSTDSDSLRACHSLQEMDLERSAADHAGSIVFFFSRSRSISRRRGWSLRCQKMIACIEGFGMHGT
jgi:hypothetical protein